MGQVAKSYLAFNFMGRIDPVEYVGVSRQRNGDVRNRNHPLCGCATFVIQKSPFRYNRVVQATIKKGKVILWQSKRIRLHIRSGCVNITSSSLLSIGEKLYIINTKLICVTY